MELRAVVSRTGHNAVSTAKTYGATYATTDFERILSDSEVDAVLIATRHNTHAAMALAALQAGKHVLLEKPLALTDSELASIAAFYEAPPAAVKPLLLTGFNRRFSPFSSRVRELVSRRSNPMIINYRMNAGYLPLDHWVHGTEGGGRNLGEACHIYDLFTFLTGARVTDVACQTFRPTTEHYSRADNFVVTLRFDDGSLATLTYTALGTPEYPKELMEVFVDGQVITLHDYRLLQVSGRSKGNLELKGQDKGQKEELVQFCECILHSNNWPIPLWQQIQATEVALRVETIIRGGQDPNECARSN